MKRITIRDDEPDIMNVLNKVSGTTGLLQIPSMISHAPLARFQLKCCDLMIMGIRMPKINGFDLYRQLKKSDTSVRVCFLAGFKSMNEEFKKMFPIIDVKAFIRKNQSAYQT
jgi:DNA-binding response OmpR family regulator